MQTPVFLDNLPDIDTITGEKPAKYRLTRNKALIELMLDANTHWTSRLTCPACGCAAIKSRNFSQTLLEFLRCTECNTIFAQRVPDQDVLDSLRLKVLDSPEEQSPVQDREVEFTSLMNWVSLTEARLMKKLDVVVDVRFASQAPGWSDTIKRLSHNRTWNSLPLSPETENFDQMRAKLTRIAPKAVLIPAELDRVADPETFMQAIKQSVAPGTVIFIASSCADGLEYEILGADSPSFIPLDRLTVFSTRGFQALSERVGFSILEISTPGRLDAVILERYFTSTDNANVPFWSGFFHAADRNRLHDLQILLQRSLKSGILRFVLEA